MTLSNPTRTDAAWIPGPRGDDPMGKNDTNNTTALAQAFGVIGNGSAEIAWVVRYT